MSTALDKMSDRQKSAKAKKQNNLEGLEDARGGKISRLDQFEVRNWHQIPIMRACSLTHIDTYLKSLTNY